VNDCVLFRGPLADKDTCPICQESRWKKDDTGESSESGGPKKRTPCKILRYFPLVPRLQRLYVRGNIVIDAVAQGRIGQ
jgi:hypothetical protein